MFGETQEKCLDENLMLKMKRERREEIIGQLNPKALISCVISKTAKTSKTSENSNKKSITTRHESESESKTSDIIHHVKSLSEKSQSRPIYFFSHKNGDFWGGYSNNFISLTAKDGKYSTIQFQKLSFTSKYDRSNMKIEIYFKKGRWENLTGFVFFEGIFDSLMFILIVDWTDKPSEWIKIGSKDFKNVKSYYHNRHKSGNAFKEVMMEIDVSQKWGKFKTES